MNEFKVGDWVRTKNNYCFKIKSIASVCHNSKFSKTYTFILLGTGRCSYFNDQEECYQKNECELWQPKEGEWVAVSSNKNDFFAVHKWSDELKEALTKNNIFEWVYEPFIGELPNFLKDKR